MNYNDMSSTYNEKLYTHAYTLVGIITGNKPITGRFGRKIPTKNQFKYYVSKHPEALLYPCKPNNNDYMSSPHPEDITSPVNPAISSFVAIENELNAKLEDGIKYLPDVYCPFPLTKDLHPTKLSHSTILDFIFANAENNNMSAQCLDGFLELFSSKQSFRNVFPSGGLSQAISCASTDSVKCVSSLYPQLLQENNLNNVEGKK